ncbi:hypothetical protein [Prauserella shujinwangii]|uniref:hypothetical protein n=1 Tax=Prauserella shujinwangii TaxID=1453103 RepID=UPI0011B1D976|nr:hypothetical protein [Prauserella shujinwangii]
MPRHDLVHQFPARSVSATSTLRRLSGSVWHRRARGGRPGESAISVADLAVALLDETERPRHRRRRFTVAY